MFANLFKSDLQKKVEELERQNKELRVKLAEKQTQINKTNAYWKGVMRKGQRKKSVEV